MHDTVSKQVLSTEMPQFHRLFLEDHLFSINTVHLYKLTH